MIYHYYFFGDKAKTGENSRTSHLHFFKGEDPGAFVSVSGGGVLKSSQHKEQALAFLKWIAGRGRPGGAARPATRSSMPSATVRPRTRRCPPLETLEAPAVDPSSLDSRKVTELMTAAGLI